MGIAFLVLSALTAMGTFFAVFTPRRPVLLGFVSWMIGLVPNELPYLSLAWSALLVLVAGVVGVLDTTLGVVGLALVLVSAAGEILLVRRAAAAEGAIERALVEALGAGYRDQIDDDLAAGLSDQVGMGRVLARPFSSRRRDVVRTKDIPYGDAGVHNLLDVYRHESNPRSSPIFVYIHGGAWARGNKDQYGLPLLYHFASRGWLCVAPNYRLCPDATFPDFLIDIKRVIAWIRANATEHDGDATRLVVAGGSAGGHLAALVALTANDPSLQPGFEDVDTSISAAIPLYADYDWLDSNEERSNRSLDRSSYLVDKILKCSPEDNRSLWTQGSPLLQVHADAPPFFVMHGDRDTMLLVEDARHFVTALRAVSTQPVAYAELPGAQHAFDGFNSVRCGYVINGAERFASWVLSAHEHGGVAPSSTSPS